MSTPVFRLKATLRGIRPPIWRRVRVPATLTLGQLHHVLQIAFGWTNSHMHQFRVGKDCFGVSDPLDAWGPDVIDEDQVRLEQVATVRSKLVYEYDFGDGWEHEVLVEGAEAASETNSDLLCLDGRRACPPEDCGGPYGYADLLDSLANPKRRGSAERLEWLGPNWDAERFEVDRVNQQLVSLRLSRRPAKGRSARSRKSG